MLLKKKKLSCIIQAQKTKKKYECEQCGYIYEPAVGNLNIDIAPKLHLRIFQSTGYAQSMDLEKMFLFLQKGKQKI